MTAVTANLTGLRGWSVAALDAEVPFGAIVSGLTRTHLQDQAVRTALMELWIDRGVLVFRGENNPEMHVELSQCFGRLEAHVFREAWVDGHAELVNIKYYPDNGSCYEIDGELRGGWLPWHSDLVYTDTINHGGILRPIQLPQSDGQTGFIDQIAAYDRLPAALQAEIADLHVVYAMDLNFSNHKFGRPGQIRFVRGARSFDKISKREYQYPRIIHPMVFTQQETGRKVLNISPGFALGIYEQGGPAGDELLRRVIAQGFDGADAYFHDWRQDDMVLWDNWRMIHSAKGIPADQTRVMQRTTIAGDYALGRKLGDSGDGLPRIDV